MGEFLLGLLKSIDWRAGLGVLFGAAISATVAYVLQRRSFAEASRQRELDKREERRALGLNVLTKMMRISSTLAMLRQSVEKSAAHAEAVGLKGQPWMRIEPIPSFPGKVHFEPKELTEIMRLDFQLFKDVGPMDDVHNVLLDLFALYRTERAALTDTLPAEMKGNLGTTEYSPEDIKKLGPRMAALNTKVAAMIQRATIDSAKAMSILERLQDALNKEFDMKLKL